MAATSLYSPELLYQSYRPLTQAYYAQVWNGFRMETHTHAQVEIMYVLCGQCDVEHPQSGRTVRTTLSSGDYILLDAGVPHRLDIPPGHKCAMKNIEFTFEPAPIDAPTLRQIAATSQDLQRLLRTKACVLHGHDAGGDLLRAFESLLTFYLYALEKPHAKALADHAFCMLLLTLAYLNSGAEPHGGALQVRRALAYMQSHFSQKLSLEDIARAVGVHPVYLQRVFKACTGQTPPKALEKMRLERAQFLLRNTTLPIAQIAQEIGFGSRQTFYRRFQCAMGRSPQTFRDAANLGNETEPNK